MAINKHLSRRHDPNIIILLMLIFAIPLTSVFAIFTYKELPWGNLYFDISAAVGAIAFSFGTFMLVEANRRCDLSIVAPIIALTPIFIVLWEWLFLGNLPNSFGFFGILMIVFGSYVLNFSKVKIDGLFAPFKSLLKKNGGRLPFLISIVFSVGATADKSAINYSDANSFAVFLSFASIALCLGYMFLVKPLFGEKVVVSKSIFVRPWWSIAQGSIFAIMIFAEIFAAKFILVSYVIATKRLSALFGVAAGAWIFKEENIRERALGAAMMVIGVVVLSLLG